MNLFKRKPDYSVCEQCGVHFEPITGRHAELCKAHREPVIALEHRKEMVLQWAEANWEELEPKAEEYRKQHLEAQQRAYQSLSSLLSAQQQNSGQDQQSLLYGLGMMAGRPWY